MGCARAVRELRARWAAAARALCGTLRQCAAAVHRQCTGCAGAVPGLSGSSAKAAPLYLENFQPTLRKFSIRQGCFATSIFIIM